MKVTAALWLVLMLWVGACAHHHHEPPCAEATADGPPPTEPHPRPYRLVDGITGMPIPDAEWGQKLRAARLVFVGEQHDNAAHHAFQFDVLKRLHAEDASLALALEMLPHTMQHSLSQFVAGQIDEPAFLEQVQWSQTWGFPFGLYAHLLRFARSQRLPAYALNAPRDLVRSIYKSGVAALAPGDAQRLPEMLPGPAEHREFARQAFAAHATARFSDHKFETFYEAQLLWDETMATHLVQQVKAPNAPAHVLVIAGEGHTRRFAVPLRVARRGVTSALLVLAVEADEVEGARASRVADVLAVFNDKSEKSQTPVAIHER